LLRVALTAIILFFCERLMESLLLDDDDECGDMDVISTPGPELPPSDMDEEKMEIDDADDGGGDFLASVRAHHMPGEAEMKNAIHSAMSTQPGAPPSVVLCTVVDWMERATVYKCHRTAALHHLQNAGPATPETIFLAIVAGRASCVREEEAISKPRSGATHERMVKNAHLNEAIESMDEDAKRIFKRGVLGLGVTLEFKAPETPYECKFGMREMLPEGTRLHPAIVHEFALGDMLYWSPAQQGWDGELREFIRRRCGVYGAPTPTSNAFLLFAVGHSAFARLVNDENLMRSYLVNPDQDERFTVYKYVNRPEFLKRVRAVLRQAEGGEVRLRERWVALSEATPSLASVLAADDTSVLADRLRLLDAAGGMDFTLLLGKWQISTPSR
jgi:hypothetical protein